MSRPAFAVLAALAAVTFASTAPLQAQSTGFARSSTTFEHLSLLRQQAATPAINSAAMVSPKSRRSGALLMIVGAAGIVTGLIVDEPVVTIAGAVVGGIGLYMYLDNSRSVQVGYRVPLPALGS